MWDSDAVELMVKQAIHSTANQAADLAQHFKPDAQFEDADPRMLALLKIAISDHIRNTLGGVV